MVWERFTIRRRKLDEGKSLRVARKLPIILCTVFEVKLFAVTNRYMHLSYNFFQWSQRFIGNYRILQDKPSLKHLLFFYREDGRMRGLFLQNLVDDRSESVMSYYEFLVHIQKQISKWAYFLVTVDSENVKTERHKTKSHKKRKNSGNSVKINGLLAWTLKSYNEALLLMKSYYRGVITGLVP